MLAARSPEACGWLNVFGGQCPIEATNDTFTWHRWEPRLRSTNDDGKDYYSDEWVPHKGTRREFLEELQFAVESGSNPWLFHTWRHKMIRHAIKLHESRKDGVTVTEWSDYAAQPEIRRAHTATCANAEKVNELVTVVGYKPYNETIEVPKRGRRPASTTVIRKQHVDVFFAFHAAGYKPNSRSYNVAQEDIDSFLKYGKVKHGEWFHMGQRLPGGDHSKPLPEGFSERELQPADFPEYERKLSVTDGCASQFHGKDNYHQTAEWYTKFGILRIHWTLETMHGKSICDALGNMPANAITEAIRRDDFVFSGPRELVVYLSRARATPAIAKCFKQGWWAVERIFYGFFEHAKFTALTVPTADGFHGSHEMHMFAGDCRDPAAAAKEGPLTVRGTPCSCRPCTALLWSECEMKQVFGSTKKVKAPRAQGETANLRQMESLSEWAASLREKQLVAVRASRREHSLEGMYWLAILKGRAFEATEDIMDSTNKIERGWLVVRAQWLKLEQQECEGGLRSYSMLDAETLIVINHTVRLSGLRFSKGKGGPQNRILRSEASGKLLHISLETHHSIEACCSVDQ